MSKGLEALEIIKNASTIYVGCASNIYTRYSFECNDIEKELKALEILKWLFDWNIMLDGYKFIFEREGKLDDYKILEDVLLKEVL